MDWEKEFDKKFPRFGADDDYCESYVWPNDKLFGGDEDAIYKGDREIRSAIKAFIRSQRQDLLKELRGEVEGIKLGGALNSNAVAYNQAIQDVIKLLEKYETI
jgi:hypothetical protein